MPESSARSTVSTEQAPAAIGPYSQAVRHGGLLFVSGQLPLDTAGELHTDSLAEQTRRCLANLEEIAAAAGARLAADALRLTIYTTEMGGFAEINEAYAAFFDGAEPPARAAVGVAALPKGAGVEIDAIVAVPEA
jgi:2-iminobutanoate/2-iminopropanoate deaminase